MWTCQNCGYSDESGSSFDEELDRDSAETVRYCPECGSDEVFLVEEDAGDDDLYDDDDDDDDDWSGDEEEDDDDEEEW